MMRLVMLILFTVNICWAQPEIDLEIAKKLYYDAKDHYYEGQYHKANSKFDSCIVIREELLSTPHELLYKVYRRKGNTEMKLRNFETAQEYLTKAVEEASDIFGEESDEIAGLYMDLGVLEGRKHRYSKSVEWNKKCIALRSKIYGPNSKEVAYTRMNNGNNLYSTGDFVKCINEYKKILAIYDKELKPNDENYNRVYLTLSNAYRKKGDLNNSLYYAKKALEIKLLNYDENHLSVAKYYANIAKIQATLYQLEKSKRNFEKAARIEEKSGSKIDHVSTMNDAARVFLKSGDFQSAKEIFEESMAFYQKDSRKYLIAKENLAISLYYLDEVERAYKILNEVVSQAPETEAFLTLSEWSRELGSTEDAKRNLELAVKYEKDGDVLTRIKILVETSIQQSDNDKEGAWGTINEAINELTMMRRRYLGSSSKNYINEQLESIFDFAVELSLDRYEEEQNHERLEDIYKTIEMAKAASFWDNLSEENAAFYGKVPHELLEEIELLKDSGDEEIMALEDKLKELEKDYPAYYQLKYSLFVPELQDIQNGISPDMLIFDYYVLEDQIVALKIGRDDMGVIKVDRQDSIDFTAEWASISNPTISRICIIPHRFIHYESFEKLINPTTGRYFLFDFAFSYQVNVQGVISDKQRVVSRDYLAFVPEFKAYADKDMQIERSTLVPLPGAINEVAEASELFNSNIFKGNEAVEGKFYELAPDYSYIHFATHAQIDPMNELNSYLILEDGEEDEDGILYADEIMKTDINAEMVILSACETGNGGLRSGEGVMSLSRAFQYAGAKSVLMSLWRANDQSAQPIIVNFLRNYKDGMPKDIALQQSKITYLKSADPLMRDEFYWAGFMINGDMSPLTKTKSWVSYLVMMLIVFGIVFLLFRIVK